MGWIFHSNINNDGEQQVLYKFSYQAKAIIIPSGIHIKKKNYKKITGASKAKLIKIENIILESLENAKDKVPLMSNPQLKRIIEYKIEGRQIDNGEVRLRLREAWQARIDYFDRAGKESSKEHNINSIKAVMALLSNYYIDEITSAHIRQLKQELFIGRSPASVAGYLRDLRATIISIVGKVNSPFIGVPLPKATKKKNVALNTLEFEKMKWGPFKSREQEVAMDMFIFRYYCLGMRIKDQLLLTRNQVVNGRISYTTHKTTKHFEFNLPLECLRIIEKYPDGKYIFPLMNTEKATINNVISSMNKILKKIAKYAGVNKLVTTHSARHTFAFLNQDKGTHFIQKAFDHESITTTEGYIESLSNQDSLVSQIN